MQRKEKSMTRDAGLEAFLILFSCGFVPFLSRPGFVSRNNILQIVGLQKVASERKRKNTLTTSNHQDALNLYRFDKKLRLILFNEIEKVEVALRSALANVVAEETGNIFWMTDASMFANADKFNRTMALVDKELKSSKEDFILHFKMKYSNAYPPAWILIEILPLGVVTRIYENLADNTLRKKIAARFSLTIPVFTSWMTVVTLTRNSCCHHSRVWNKSNAIPPLIPKKLNGKWVVSIVSPKRIFYNICIIKWFVDIVSPNNDMKGHLQQLLADHPMIDIKAMGFPANWQEEPLWKE